MTAAATGMLLATKGAIGVLGLRQDAIG